MRVSQRTEGATLMASLLLVMLLLAAIMAVTAQVTLNTRRSSIDQRALLSARYAAESGVATVQARLRVMKLLLDQAAIEPSISNSAVSTLIAQLCAQSSLPAITYTNTETSVCVFNLATGLNDSNPDSRVALFNLSVKDQVFKDVGFVKTDLAARTAFWASLFSGVQGVPYNTTFSDNAELNMSFGLKVKKLTEQNGLYRLYFDVPALKSSGKYNNTTQNIEARASTQSSDKEYYLMIGRGSFAKYALFINKQYENLEGEQANRKIYFSSDDILTGPVHTNQTLAFLGQPVFWGEVSSAGCPALSLQNTIDTQGNSVTSCTQALTPGAVFGGNGQFIAKDKMNSLVSPSANGSAPQFKSTVNWNSEVKTLPTNSIDQYKLALANGLALNGNVDELQLYTETIDSELRQRITYRQNGITTHLSYNSTGKLFIQNNSNWVAAGRTSTGMIVPATNPTALANSSSIPFSGIIAANNVDVTGVEMATKAKILDLNGGPDLSKPSLASFARATIAASGDIGITSDLKYSDVPCDGSATATATAPCNNLAAKNILGLYSSSGNINLISDQDPARQATRLGNNPTIDAVLMASQGAVQVSGYANGAPKGTIKILGGVIANYLAPTAIADNNGNKQTGYGTNFVYDQRAADGYTPPGFPLERSWSIGLGSKNDGKDVGLDTRKGIRLQGDSVAYKQVP